MIEFAAYVYFCTLLVCLAGFVFGEKKPGKKAAAVSLTVRTTAFVLMSLCIIAFNTGFIWRFEYLFNALYIVLLADILCDILWYVTKVQKKERNV